MKSDVRVVGTVVAQAESLIKSLKGVRDARVHADASGRVTHIALVTTDGDERAATRNVQSALFAALGIHVDAGTLQFEHNLARAEAPTPVLSIAPQPQKRRDDEIAEQLGAQVLEISGAVRKADLNGAARAAFDTLRAAQSSFHGFVFDGAELVTINGSQYIVVAVRRSTTEARYCGAAPVIDSVSTASARALMNAVGVAAMASPAFDFAVDAEGQPEIRKA